MSTLDITPAQDIVQGDGYWSEGITLLLPMGWSTPTNRRSIGMIFHIPSGFDANSTINSLSLRLRSNNASGISTFDTYIFIGDSPNFANTNDPDTGNPNYRLNSTATPPGTGITGQNGIVGAGSYLYLDLHNSDLISAIQANPNHSVSGTNLAIGVYPFYTAGGAQQHAQFLSSEHSTTPDYRPTLQIEYTSTALVAQDSSDFSKSFGFARIGPEPECWGRWHGDDPELQTKEALFPMSTTGSGDLPPTSIAGTGLANPNGTAWALWGVGGLQPDASRVRLNYDPGIASHKPRPLNHHSIWHEAYDNNSAFSRWNTSYWRSEDGPLSTASMRWTKRWTGLPSNGFPEATVIKAYYQGAVVWEVRLRGFTFDNNSHMVTLRQFVGGTTSTGWSANRWLYGTPRRCEMQVSNEASPELQFRAYWDDTEGTPENVLSLACSDVTFDMVEFGTERSPFTGLVNVYLDDVDLWDDYYLNGYWRDESNHGTIEHYREWEVYEWDGTDFNQVDVEGRVDIESPLALEAGFTFDGLGDYEGERWLYDGATGTNVDDLAYDFFAENYLGSAKTGVDLYVPKGTPPDGGWPLYIWLHGGFFVSGGRYQMPNGLAVELTRYGWAVASIDIRLSDITPLVNNTAGTSPQSYPAWNPNQDTARHPTQILDVKAAVEYFQRDAQKTTYGLSGMVVVGGHSAGGYPATMAMITKDVTDNGNGLSYRLQDHNGTYGFPIVDDPEIAGCYVWSPPMDFDVMDEFDFTRRAGLIQGNSGRYTMGNTIAFYFGHGFATNPSQADLDGSSIPLLAENVVPIGNLKPMVYAGGRSDHLVPSDSHYQKYGWDQAKLIEDAYISRGLGNIFESKRHAEVQHYQTPYRRDAVHLIQFLKKIENNEF